MFSPARWVHELYPVDEMLAKELGIPLEKITMAQMEAAGKPPTYRVHAYDKSGKEMLAREFTVTTIEQPYNGVMPEYEKVEVDTGWVRMESGTTAILDRRIATDIEEFWEHYHKVTLPKAFRTIMASYHGDLRTEFAPPFDTLKIDIHMSEPDYELGIDKERISPLEALQEDTFYSTENFVNMMGDLLAGRAVTYAGRIIPIVHASDDGKDSRIRIEFYAKPAGGPQVELSWTDAQGIRHERKRDMWALSGAMQPRLIAARARAGEAGPESLTWLLPADFKDDEFEEWIKLEGKEQVERGMFSAEQAQGQLAWLEKMHDAGLYPNELAYPQLKRMAFEFEMPLPLTAKVDSAAPRAVATLKIAPPAAPRPMIADFAGRLKRSQLVQWDEPISPEENTFVLAELAKHPGVNVYWMGRSYLGKDIWAADIGLPTPSKLRSWAKETTLKASIVYSGRQHANEVSSTSHILKLGEQLTTDAETAGRAEEGERGAASDHQPRWRRAFGAARRDHAEQHAASRVSRGAGGGCLHGAGGDGSGLSGIAHAAPVAGAVAAGRVPESAWVSIARVGAAVFGIFRLGDQPAGRQQRAHLVDSARLVYQPDLPARRYAPVQLEDCV